MSVYMTEEEQIEAIRDWFKANGHILLVLISVVFLGIAGFKYWNWHKEKINIQASSSYENLMTAVANHDDKSIKLFSELLIKEFNHTAYSDAAHLTLAKTYIQHHDYAKAIAELKKVMDRSDIPALREVATIRMARIYKSQKKYDEALALLTPMSESIYKPIVNELVGDVYAKKQDFQHAASAYKVALKESQAKGIENLFLEMKSNEVSASIKNN